ncbi:CinA family protein [Actinoalloteichus hymeniacidonis]|uniref:CinA family protein n=1 Tax=Actinoalloteichus hymeniacidonis TaxID=340345 RepID=UPI000852E33D
MATTALSRVVDTLRARGQTLALAESLTGGLLGAALTSIAGVSDVFRGGLVVYATDLKIRLAGVDAEVLAEHGAVHPTVAEQLATGARDRCLADWGIGVTGVAGPTAQDGAAPGTVHVAVCGPTRLLVRSARLAGDRSRVRHGAIDLACGLLADVVMQDAR